ncbi:YbaB/EbfC family nucleoid-associated protein [Kribbella sp. NPDC050124]|uniref:YbaB/EbfC family nucleoid-associated protein n=1 Tax=Kribbella sp. NPDC050124 TaxID=3364114 RepID=UPI0037AFEF92
MFDGGGAGGFDMSDLLAQAQAMQNQLMEAQANLESQEIEGSAGGGLVTALVSGTGELLSLNIKPEAVDPDDTETLADLVVAAVRDASENAKQIAAQAMGPLAGGIPGFGSEGPGFGGGSSAPAGFTLPGAAPGGSITGGGPTIAADTPDEDDSGPDGSRADGPSASGSSAADSASGSSAADSTSGVSAGESSGAPGAGPGAGAGGVGFVNPGGGAGLSGRDSG